MRKKLLLFTAVVMAALVMDAAAPPIKEALRAIRRT